MVRRIALLFTLSLSALASGGCVNATSPGSDEGVPTGIDVSPQNFLGVVPCSSQPGGMQSYVATLLDVTDAEDNFTLPSSVPTPCSEGVDFRYVIVNHAYIAEVDGYEAPFDDIGPLGGPDDGSRHVVSPPGGDANQILSPRWTGSCGNGDGNAAVASVDFDVLIGGCEPLSDHQGAVATGIEVDPLSTLDVGFQCDEDMGNVANFTITVEGKTLPAQFPQDCQQGAQWLFDVDVRNDVAYRFDITARNVAGMHLATTTCYATGVAGLIVVAACDPLNPVK